MIDKKEFIEQMKLYDFTIYKHDALENLWQWLNNKLTESERAVGLKNIVIKPPFTLLEIDFIETLIRDDEDEGSYYGNFKHYGKRRKTIKNILEKMKKAL